MRSIDPFEEIHELLRAENFTAALALLLDQRSGKIRPTFEHDLNHAWYVVGDINYRMQFLDKAVEAFRKALDDWPEDAEACMALGNALSDLGNAKEAETWFRRGLDLTPVSEGLQYNLANALIDQGREKEAAEILLRIPGSDSETSQLARKNLELVKARLKRRRCASV